MTVTFFGHKDTPASTEHLLKATLISLIENDNADTFYVGHNGAFDFMAHRQLRELSKKYPITYTIVLSHLPSDSKNFDDNTLFPEGIELVHPKFSICWRNNWMITHSDIVVTYVSHNFGGAAKFQKTAEKKQKRIINLNL